MWWDFLWEGSVRSLRDGDYCNVLVCVRVDVYIM